MSLLHAIILGIVQGLTEFLPVSSSGHLILAENLLGITQSLAFDVALHVGTLVALFAVFGKDLIEIAMTLGRGKAGREARIIIFATIPALILGFLASGPIEDALRTNWIVGFNLIGIGVVMFLVERSGPKTKESVDSRDGLVIGAAQALAILPGVSRSGITIAAGMMRGITREAAMRFSFLLSAPVIAGAAVKVFVDPEALHQVADQKSIFLVGTLTAAVSGYFAIRFMLSYLAKHKLDAFAYYRIALGAVVLVLLR